MCNYYVLYLNLDPGYKLIFIFIQNYIFVIFTNISNLIIYYNDIILHSLLT